MPSYRIEKPKNFGSYNKLNLKIMKPITQNKLRYLFLLPFFLIGFYLVGYPQGSAAGFLVTGKVNNAKGEKAVGAVILVKGTTTGTVTDTNGFFSIKVPTKESVLVISHFSTPKSTEVILNGSQKVVIKLASETQSQDLIEISYRLDSTKDENKLDFNFAKNFKSLPNGRKSIP